MDIELIPLTQFQTFLICTSRVGGFIGAMPVFSGPQTPARLKAALVFAISLILFPITRELIPVEAFSMLSFLLFLISELLIGMLIGLVGRLVFTAVEFGGTVIGFQMGFAAANVFDPQNQRQISLISQFQNVFAIFIFLAIDGHHLFIRTALKSFTVLPPGGIDLSGEAVPYLITLSSSVFSLGVQFSAPVLAVLLLSGLILGILARTFPQGNVFLLSFPLNIGISFVVIGLTLDLVALMLRREFDDLGNRFLTLLSFLSP